MAKSIANPALASEIADTIRNKAEEVIAKKKQVKKQIKLLLKPLSQERNT